MTDSSIQPLIEKTDGPDTRGLLILLHGGPGGNSDGPDGLLSELAEAARLVGWDTERFELPGSSYSHSDYSDVSVAGQMQAIEPTVVAARKTTH